HCATRSHRVTDLDPWGEDFSAGDSEEHCSDDFEEHHFGVDNTLLIQLYHTALTISRPNLLPESNLCRNLQARIRGIVCGGQEFPSTRPAPVAPTPWPLWPVWPVWYCTSQEIPLRWSTATIPLHRNGSATVSPGLNLISGRRK